jgi:hypothetical protein
MRRGPQVAFRIWSAFVQHGLGRTEFMLFAEYDLGFFSRLETGRESPRIIRFIVRNPLIMREMVKYVPDAGSYAPVTILVDERSDGVYVSYDYSGPAAIL